MIISIDFLKNCYDKLQQTKKRKHSFINLKEYRKMTIIQLPLHLIVKCKKMFFQIGNDLECSFSSSYLLGGIDEIIKNKVSDRK